MSSKGVGPLKQLIFFQYYTWPDYSIEQNQNPFHFLPFKQINEFADRSEIVSHYWRAGENQSIQ